MRGIRPFALFSAALSLCFGVGSSAQAAPPTPAQLARIRQALPKKAPATPGHPRKLLIFTLTRGYRHSSIECGAAALKLMGERTGAYRATVSDDPAVFTPESLRAFDAVCFLNTTGELFDNPAYKQSLLDFVRGGKGLVGIHAATDCFYKWPAYGEMIGGYFDGHPWHANDTVTIRVEEPQHPLCRCFPDKTLTITDEIYQFRDPYSRRKLRVLLSLDTKRTDMKKGGIHRTDGDFAVSWIRNYGQGRVYYCSLGHREDVYWNPVVLRYYLAGIQFALGDLKADATPRAHATETPASPPAAGWTPLFDGRTLAGWKGLVASPVQRARMTPAELAAAQAKADEVMRAHWKVVDGVLAFDGHGQSLCTAKDYGDFELMVDWKIGPGGDSGIYLRGSPQVQIWDATQHPEGSGGLYNNRNHPSKPIVRADKPVGQWNTFRIRMVGQRVTVWLNDTLVVDDVPLENYWERDKPIYPTGQIELQSHNSPLWFRNIKIREIPPAEAKKLLAAPTWRPLFNGHDLSGWTCKPGTWDAADGLLTCRGGSYIWTAERFGDFELDLEFRIPPRGNSGIFFRTADPADPVQTGIELQIYDTFGQQPPGRNHCGAIYDCLAPRVQAVRKPGEWNHVVLRCAGPHIRAWMNGYDIIDMNLDDWTEPHKNPDGSHNKFRTAYKDMPREGFIGFQDHGAPVSFRKIYIRPLR